MSNKKYEFSETEKNYIIDNWGKESATSMKNKIGCSWHAVCRVASEYGLELPTSNNWTEEETNLLKKLSDKYHYAEIAKIMNKTETAIYLKAKKLGITLIQGRRKWTPEEEIMLSDLWGTKPIEYIAKKMKRTTTSLQIRAKHLELGPMIRNNYDLITISDMEDLLSVDRNRIVTTWVKLGLKLKKIKLTQRFYMYTITWKDLMDFLESNQNEWDSRKVEKNMLGPEPTWLQEKRKRDIKENPLWYRLWTEEEIRQTEMLFKSGKNYQEISIIMNRSSNAIGILLRRMGYSSPFPQYWQDYELEYLRENYQNMSIQEIAEELGRTEKAISSKAEKMGYSRKLTKYQINGGKENG